MVKVHTRLKRKLRSPVGRSRAVRPKTFKTEEAANKYAKDNKISKYELVNISLGGNKFKIVQKD